MESQADPSDPLAISSEDYLFDLDMPCDLMSEWDIQQAREQPIAVIGVKDVQLSAPVGASAWGWNGVMAECPIQPILVSVSVALRRNFKTASEDDDLTEDTIHYGRLRSAILEAVHRYNTKFKPDNAAELSIKNVVTHLISALTVRHHLTIGKKVNWSSVKVMLPKSSLHGAGTSLTMQTIYREEMPEDQDPGSPESFGVIGRSAMEESSFQTLEALAEHIGKLLIRYVLIPKIIGVVSTASSEAANTWDSLSDDYKKVPWEETNVGDFRSIVKIKLEKPGIYMDTIPGVEMSMDFQPQPNSPYFDLWENYKKLKTPERSYNGTLKDWIAENYPEEPLAYRKRKLEASETELAKSRKITEEINSHPSSSDPTTS
ncbi:hypothetical protein SS1G_04236 [Sclerotinia sclerotiorum 1980 UF-70]|uniref:Dihydroneopterin aldolase/epimerase domain-containing protein n=1 Tax=Sclerotinia sclerotiorum (strain ATCC 18683 / 1980 / Ss-1) TaxID=665079 RepID=A7EFZ5_SCLS1|nr:hypothetical protein SS1G_04236 [Sclerotinia sclerotiorum 1980 UF-70]EDO01761.1 hypothetical protein SS1G_04236 [Sclerotinia sclerotiorum 1980 UF-70]